ncbi:MAG: hypothetical protein OXT67_10535 [Zetaproteobacteria bacterium]|nr:hypothetical protein [Zetaproteobacteria bacterium]
MRAGVKIVVALLVLRAAVGAAQTDVTVHVAPGKYKNFHHLEFVLTRANTRAPFGASRYGARQLALVDGQFEVFVHKSHFPIAARPGGEFLILRMPAGADATKTLLFGQVAALLRGERAEVQVVVELDPYYDPLQQRLRENNIFFRTAGGKYIDRVGKLDGV